MAVQPRPGCTPRAISQISSASSATPRGAITAKRSVLGTRHDGDDGRGAGDAKAAPSDRGAKVDRTVR